MKILLSAIFFYGISILKVPAQSMVNSSGATIQDNFSIIEYSIGEIAITTLESDSSFISQGLLQPALKFINPTCEIINSPLLAFPNPTRNNVTLFGQYEWITGYQIIAADGKFIKSVSFFNNPIDLSPLPPGIYIIQLNPACDNLFRVIKVVKQ